MSYYQWAGGYNEEYGSLKNTHKNTVSKSEIYRRLVDSDKHNHKIHQVFMNISKLGECSNA